MDHSSHNKIVSFIWSIADDCLRDVYVRGKYRDVILPMFVLRRLDCLLEPKKEAVLEEVRFQREDAGFTDLDPEGLREASGYVFYNTSDWTLKKLVSTASNKAQILEANFKAYLDGFSDNVKEIIDRFKLREQIATMVDADVLLDVLEKFTAERINLSPHEAFDPDGRKLPPLSNLGMGYVFEELIRKFNEENNEEAGEHFTPREVIQLMTHLLFEPIKDRIPPVITVYDGACGSGGMLTESQDFITHPDGPIASTAEVYLYGKEVNGETYAICKSDMMIKGNNPENIKFGSTLATDDFSGLRFDFMLSNPPYGKSWKSDQKFILDGKDVLDPRFQVRLTNFQGEEKEESATPRSSDGQLLFLMDMAGKMKSLDASPLGSRVASVHNGSSLFTGDAGSGESNIRRYLIENDLLDAIIQLPNNLFYNTGITTYIWILSNNKPAARQGKVQLIDASQLFRKLRKNLGNKNCEFAPEHIEEIMRLYSEMPDNGTSKVFANRDFGYYKVTVERPLRKAAQFTAERVATLRFVSAIEEPMRWAYERWGDALYTELPQKKKTIEDYLEREDLNLSPKNKKALLDPKVWQAQRELMQVAQQLHEKIGDATFDDFNRFTDQVDSALKEMEEKLSATQKKQILNAVSWTEETAAKIVKKVHKLSGKKLAALLQTLGTTKEHLPDFGYWPSGQPGEWIEYETDSDLRDTENIPLNEDIHDYFLREVRPHVEDAWLDLSKTQIGYEISFNKYFYQHQPLRSLEDVTADILQLEAQTEGLLKKIVSFGEVAK
ncbi:class I SAM-dependent DNA methyltransferase [Pelagicoccus sp. SDUM812002]|uniref:type I restriction-modification system subunit M n=1 Tax=Pelagicoccus sp. SDUM812002 TaxID=3041266 RepID=UPI00280FD65E|nr:class I SAM-dependent DNA methyltransferase [Pelagicoccus sp. SDUM812002]MDQ8184082.1 class I SAM-dependent DNA methyltransferase [Pelagicoccus sp. SDUM812002]